MRPTEALCVGAEEGVDQLGYIRDDLIASRAVRDADGAEVFPPEAEVLLVEEPILGPLTKAGTREPGTRPLTEV